MGDRAVKLTARDIELIRYIILYSKIEPTRIQLLCRQNCFDSSHTEADRWSNLSVHHCTTAESAMSLFVHDSIIEDLQDSPGLVRDT